MPDPTPAAPRRAKPGKWRSGLLGLVAAVLLWFLVSRFAEVARMARTLSEGRWDWLLAAAAFQLVYYGLYALNYQQAFLAAGIPGKVRAQVPVLLASLAVGEVAPLGWAAGSAIFVQQAVRQGRASERAVTGTLLAQAADLVAFTATFALGLLVLFIRHDLRPYEVVGALVLLLMNAALAALFVLSLRHPTFLPRVLGRLPSRVAGWAGRLATGLAATAAEVRAEPRRPLAALAAAFGAHAANLLSLLLVFRAFGQPVGAGTLIAGYGVGTLAWMVSPIPAGVGVVEGAMALLFTSLGVPAERAAVVSVAYRGLNFWLPFVVGIVCLRRLERAPAGTPPAAVEPEARP